VNPVDATVGRNQKTAAGIERDIMRVRAGSSLVAVRSDLALRRDHVRIRGERPVRVDREYGDALAIADDDVTVARVRREVSGVVAAGWLLVEKSNPAARLVDRVGTHIRAVAVNRIEEFLLAVECDELRVRHGLKGLHQSPCTGLIYPVHADAFGARVALSAGETSDVGKQRRCGPRRFRATRRFSPRNPAAGR